jgi:LPS export ABC transporter permease LptG/LPS export ABC transporter permease LptF
MDCGPPARSFALLKSIAENSKMRSANCEAGVALTLLCCEPSSLMLTTIDRYIIREVVPPFILSLLIFTFVLELPPVMQELERLLAKGVPWPTVGRIILLLSPQALGLTIPMALLVGLLIGLGRLSTDREAVALLACGVSPYRLLRPVLTLAGVATAATLYVMIAAIPDANQKYREILFATLSKKVESDVKPRVFFQDFPNWVLYPRNDADPGQPGWNDVMLANTVKPEAVEVHMARHGRIVLDSAKRTVELILTDGTKYATVGPGESSIDRFKQIIIRLDPDSVFPPVDLARGLTEKTIAQLKVDIADKVRRKEATHNEVMAIHAKFSIPVACLVFAVIALALGLRVSRDGKLGGFVVGIGVIFAYYIAMFLAESMAKGHRIPAEFARWVPNLLLGPFGIVALVWRTRHVEGRLPFGVRFSKWRPPAWVASIANVFSRLWRGPLVGARGGRRATTSRPGVRPGVVLVVRIPRFNAPMPSLIDRYISRLYVRVAGLSFLALLGLFYISTFIDRSDKIFKGQATTAMIGQLLILLTPQFIYYVIPIAALLSALVTYGLLARSSELTVMKACGISLYRTALSVVVLSLAMSAVLFGLEQRLMASANRQAEALDARIRGRQPRTLNLLNRRWVVGSDRVIYHYGLFDPQRNEMFGLTMFAPRRDQWELSSETFVRRAVFNGNAWTGESGWSQDFMTDPPKWTTIERSPLPGMESPDYFTTEPPDAELMSVSELRQYTAELEPSGYNTTPLKVELHRKLAFPFVTLVMSLLAVPFGISAGRHGALYGIGLGIVIALSYWVLISAFIAIGKAGLLTPVLAGWAPNILVVGLAAYLFLRART